MYKLYGCIRDDVNVGLKIYFLTIILVLNLIVIKINFEKNKQYTYLIIN